MYYGRGVRASSLITRRYPGTVERSNLERRRYYFAIERGPYARLIKSHESGYLSAAQRYLSDALAMSLSSFRSP